MYTEKVYNITSLLVFALSVKHCKQVFSIVEVWLNESFVVSGGLLLSVLDSALFEEMDQVTQPDVVSNDSASNLLSSGTSYVFLCPPVYNTSS